MNDSDHYLWITAFNEQNLITRESFKNNKTHILDSILTKSLSFQGPDVAITTFSKSFYFLEDLQDIKCSYRRSNFESEWEPYTYSVTNFDNTGMLISSSYNAWDGDLNNYSEDDPLILRNYFYNEDNQLIEYHSQSQSELRTKTLGNVYNFYYNEDGLLESRTFRKWSLLEDSLILKSRHLYDYKNGLIKLQKEYDNDENRGYYASDSILYEHNHLGLLEQEIIYQKSGISNEWLLDRTESKQYNSEAKIEKIERRLFYQNIELDMDTLLYFYHTYGSLANISTVETDITSSGLFPDIKYKLEYSHDSSLSYAQVRTFRDGISLYEQNHMLIEFNELVNNEPGGSMYGVSILTNTNYTQYFYSKIIDTSINDEKEYPSFFIVSPNPTSDLIEIFSSNEYNDDIYLQLNDINGHKVLEAHTYSRRKIDITHLNKGVYVYTIIKDKKKSIGKLIIH